MDNCAYKNRLGNEVTETEYNPLSNINVVPHSDVTELQN